MPIDHQIFGHRRRMRSRLRMRDRGPLVFLEVMFLANLVLTSLWTTISICALFASVEVLSSLDLSVSIAISLGLLLLKGSVLFAIKFGKRCLVSSIRSIVSIGWKIGISMLTTKVQYLSSVSLTLLLLIFLSLYEGYLNFVINNWPEKTDQHQQHHNTRENYIFPHP